MSETYTPPTNSLADRLAMGVSGIFSPFLVIPVFATWVIRTYSFTDQEFVLNESLFVGLTTILPLIWILIGVRKGRYSDIHIQVREQRGEPFLVAVAGSCLLVLCYTQLRVPRELLALGVNVAINGLIFFLLTQKWKVSIHAAAFAAGVTIVSFLVNPNAIWLGALLPLIVWARLKRKRHNLRQALLATVAVVLVTLATFYSLGLRPLDLSDPTGASPHRSTSEVVSPPRIHLRS